MYLLEVLFNIYYEMIRYCASNAVKNIILPCDCCLLDEAVLIRGYTLCFYAKIQKTIPIKPLIIWSIVATINNIVVHH